MNKQICLTLPQNLFKASRNYSQKRGYRSTQELIVDLLRRNVLDAEERYDAIEREMDNDPNVKTFSTKEDALRHLDSL